MLLCGKNVQHSLVTETKSVSHSLLLDTYEHPPRQICSSVLGILDPDLLVMCIRLLLSALCRWARVALVLYPATITASIATTYLSGCVW